MTSSDATPELDLSLRIESPRLVIGYLDPNSDAQCDFVVEVVNTPEFIAGNGGGTPTPDRATARELLSKDIPYLAQTGFGRYIVALKPEPKDDIQPGDEQSPVVYIGWVTMKMRHHPNSPTIPDIGFQIARQFWRRGYASEAAGALLKYFEEKRGIHEFAGYCNEDNEASQKTLQRVGFENHGMRTIAFSPTEPTLSVLVWTKGLRSAPENYRL
ncbi:acyl-CoA N-acyltransferase [Aaosphaeria arxii CBS 175.79]|uniref:Acyl-CoA N-acyltransferase n=1 Tax=Aaosphaeria arxii CBS 175.79 TaxID=1450172 RepID=A0A6A5Y2C6_9PLEO|nr:acyl-CoA N-acyltransferase [Aaosphaeria arxii CBS 175.79]KAF2019197.1 acyl-CoA N-acyltransferase [Aaosphaeria arxii CBS 175.79]